MTTYEMGSVLRVRSLRIPGVKMVRRGSSAMLRSVFGMRRFSRILRGGRSMALRFRFQESRAVAKHGPENRQVILRSILRRAWLDDLA